MKSTGTLGSLLGAILMITMFFRVPGPQPGAVAQPKRSSNRTVPAEEGGADETQRRRAPEDGPWKASQQHFAGAQSGRECPSRSLPTGTQDTDRRKYLWCIPSGDNSVQAVIAILPDPIHTHVALAFDRSVEAIQLAANKMNYVIDQYWLPWDSEPTPQWADYESRQRATMQERQKQEQPGLLMFRWNGDADASQIRVLYVFLVSDTTTAGINGKQFTNAVDYVGDVLCADQMKQPSQPRCEKSGDIRIMGPTSSGSLASLRRLTDQRPELFTAYSGTVSSAAAIRNQRFELPPWPKPNSTEQSTPQKPDSRAKPVLPRVRLRSFVTSSESSIGRFLAWLDTDQGIHCNDHPEVAILSEAATTYGSITAKSMPSGDVSDQCQPTRFLYPRDISSLRNAYRRAAGSAPAPEATDRKAADTASPYLSFNLSDSTNTSDEPPDFSNQQGPLSKEAVLMQFGAEIRRNHYKYVGIAGSNVLDVLFLAEFLRKACPDTRLFTVDSDLLFERELDNAPYLGTLAVSTFPLIGSNPDWTKLVWTDRKQPSARLPFSDTFEEGQYNAALATIHEIVNGVATLDLLEHQRPFKQLSRPIDSQSDLPLWLTAVGTGGYWPIQLFPADHDQDLPRPAELQSNEFSPAWKAVTVLACIFSFLHTIILLIASPANSFRDFALTTTAPARRLFFIHVSSATLALAVAMLATPAWRFRSSDSLSVHVICVLALAAISGLLAICGLLHWNYRRWSRALPKWEEEARKKGPRFRVGLASLCIWAVAFALWCGWWPLFTDSSNHYGFFFAYRTVHLATGVSPLTPLLPLLIAIYVWTIFATLRLRFGDQVRPQLDVRPYLPGHDKEGGIASTVNRFFLERKYRIIFYLTFTIWLLFFDPLHPFQLFEQQPFGLIYELLFCLVVALMLATGFRLGQIWLKFKKLLNDLERSRIRFAFSRLKGFSWSPIWRPGGQSVEWTNMERSFESIRNIETRSNDGSLEKKEAIALQASLKAVQSSLSEIGVGLRTDLPIQHVKTEVDQARTALKGISAKLEAHPYAPSLSPQVTEIHSTLTEISEALADEGKKESIQIDLQKIHSQLRPILGRLRLRTASAVIQEKVTRFHEEKALLQSEEMSLPALAHARNHPPATDAFYNLDVCFGDIQSTLASILNNVLDVLDEHWSTRCPDLVEGEELEKGGKEVRVNCRPEKIKPDEQHIRQLEEYAALRYVAFIRGVLGHMRYLLIFLGVSFSLVLISLNIYSFEPHQSLIWSFTAIFTAIGFTVVMVLMQTHKDHILSRITDTTPNELGTAFYIRIVTFGAAPLLALIATNFPSIGRYLLSFLQPGLEALK